MQLKCCMVLNAGRFPEAGWLLAHAEREKSLQRNGRGKQMITIESRESEVICQQRHAI